MNLVPRTSCTSLCARMTRSCTSFFHCVLLPPWPDSLMRQHAALPFTSSFSLPPSPVQSVGLSLLNRSVYPCCE
jgi:hypothetical protein